MNVIIFVWRKLFSQYLAFGNNFIFVYLRTYWILLFLSYANFIHRIWSPATTLLENILNISNCNSLQLVSKCEAILQFSNVIFGVYQSYLCTISVASFILNVFKMFSLISIMEWVTISIRRVIPGPVGGGMIAGLVIWYPAQRKDM